MTMRLRWIWGLAMLLGLEMIEKVLGFGCVGFCNRIGDGTNELIACKCDYFERVTTSKNKTALRAS